MATVWVLSYSSDTDEHDNGVVGVYATEELARAAGLEEARRHGDPKTRCTAEWTEQGMIWRDGTHWYPVRPHHYVQEWTVTEGPKSFVAEAFKHRDCPATCEWRSILEEIANFVA